MKQIWRKATAHVTTEGDYWFIKEDDLTVKLWIPKGKKMWQASVDGVLFVDDTASPEGPDRVIPPKRWRSVEAAKKELEKDFSLGKRDE